MSTAGAAAEEILVDVQAGRTSVIELKARAPAGPGPGEDQTTPGDAAGTGSLEIVLKNPDDSPYTDPVWLEREGKVYQVTLNETGTGVQNDLPAGHYKVHLEEPVIPDQPAPPDPAPPDSPPSGEPVKLEQVIYFETDKATLNKKEKDKLNQAAVVINDMPGEIISVECRGFADKRGSKTYNDNLCLNRSRAVREYLRTKLDDPRYELKPAFGEGAVAEGDDLAGNRRVELWVQAKTQEVKLRSGGGEAIVDTVIIFSGQGGGEPLTKQVEADTTDLWIRIKKIKPPAQLKIGAWQGAINDEKEVARAVRFIKEHFDPKGKLVIYGYSSGGGNALHVVQAIEENNKYYNMKTGEFFGSYPDGMPADEVVNVRIHLLITVDVVVATGNTSNQIPGLVVKNINYYNPEPVQYHIGETEKLSSETVIKNHPLHVPHADIDRHSNKEVYDEIFKLLTSK